MPYNKKIINQLTGKEDFGAELSAAEKEYAYWKQQYDAPTIAPDFLKMIDADFISMKVHMQTAQEDYNAILQAQAADKVAEAAQPKEPSQASYNAVAAALGVDAAAIRAVRLVESGADPYLDDGTGRPKILFEPAKFQEATGHKYDKTHPYISNSETGSGTYTEQYKKLEEAIALDPEAAYASVSYTPYQILGSNYKKAGNFKSAKEFADKMLKGTQEDQLMAFENFILNSPKRLKYLKKHDWANFAHVYNGPRYKANKYDTKLDSFYNKLKDDPFLKIDDSHKEKYPEKNEQSKKKIPPPAQNATNESSSILTSSGFNAIPGKVKSENHEMIQQQINKQQNYTPSTHHAHKKTVKPQSHTSTIHIEKVIGEKVGTRNVYVSATNDITSEQLAALLRAAVNANQLHTA